MIKRQPAHEYVGGACGNGAADPANVCEQVCVAQHDAFWITRAPGCVLNKRGGGPLAESRQRDVGGVP